MGSNYVAGNTYRIRIVMRDPTNSVVPGLSGSLVAAISRPDGTPDPSPPAAFAEVLPGLYEFVYTFAAGSGSYTLYLSDPGPAVTSIRDENVLNNDFDTIVEEVRILRQGNMQVEFILNTGAQILNRSVEVGRVNYEELKWKRNTDVDWSAPIAIQKRYWWYRELGDYHPWKVGNQT